jgi:glycosyltransferase involved in cell wall biosynthesis
MTRNPRVLMISKALVVGIYQRKVEDLARLDVDLTVVVPPSWRDERGETHLERSYTEGYQLEVLPLYFNGNFHLHFYRGLGTLIGKLKPDIVHIDEEPYNLSAWQALWHARRVGAKSLFFSWQNIVRDYPPPFRWGESWLLRNVDAGLVGTQSAEEVWRAKGFQGELRVVPQFGTDPTLFQPAATRPERPFTFGYFGRLVEEKGLLVLFDALTQLTGDWHMLIVGGGPLHDMLQEHAAGPELAGRITFHAQVASTEMPGLYQRIDALVLPSLTRPNWKEQFGRVLVEAMSCAVPLIGSDSGAIPDVMGEGGLVVSEGEAEALAVAMRKLRDDPGLAYTLGQAGRRRVISNFTHQAIAQQTQMLYAWLMD